MIRNIVVPQSNKIVFTIPQEMVGKKIEMIAFEIPNDFESQKQIKTENTAKNNASNSALDELFGLIPDMPSQEEIRKIAWKS
jgi:hypothetical protein